MLAHLRYRRIAYRLLVSHQAIASMPQAKVALLPTFYFPNGQGGLDAVVDSTPIIRRLERDHGGRSVIPPDPVMNLSDAQEQLVTFDKRFVKLAAREGLVDQVVGVPA